MMIDSPITSTPGPSRKSLGSRNNPSLLRKTLNKEDCNDDDAERNSLVSSERVASSTPASTRTNTDQSISLTPQKEHYQGCLKMHAENKITKDNAWNLQLIDFMTKMLQRHDQRMDDLLVASTVMEASSKIYAYRVDAVHHDALLMAGGISKAVHTKRGKKADENAEDDGLAGSGASAPVTKKKKRMKGATTANPDLLNGDFETNLCIDPFLERVAATTGDVTSSNRAFNATLPIHDETLTLTIRMDVRFLEPVQDNVSEAIELAERIALPARLLPPFAARDQVCPPFTGFSISDWDVRAEQSEPRAGGAGGADELNLSQQAVAFDMHADVEPVPGDEEPLAGDEEPLAGVESEEEGDLAVAACVARAAAPPPPRLTDMRPAGSRDARLEYSYCGVLSAWAGPAHWRLKQNRASRACSRSAAEPPRRAARARRPLDFLGAGLAFDWRAPAPDYEPAPPAKITISRKTLATGPAWSDHNYKTPVDRGLDESLFRRLFLRRAWERARAGAPEPERLSAEQARDYDYDNENDASYCPANLQEGSQWAHEEGAAAGDACRQQPDLDLGDARPQPNDLDLDLGDMIEPPAKVAKVFIPHAMRAKKVDMKQLKLVLWRLLEEGGGEPTSLFALYGRARARLAAEARDSLSVALALLALLHLANERGLELRRRPGLDDVDIRGPEH